jgi:hypothetical protein
MVPALGYRSGIVMIHDNLYLEKFGQKEAPLMKGLEFPWTGKRQDRHYEYGPLTAANRAFLSLVLPRTQYRSSFGTGSIAIHPVK